jgi:hypothetical protein
MLRERNPLLLHTDHFGFGAAPELDRLAEDLRPIREQIRSAPGVFTEQRSAWLDQLHHIDDSKSTSAAAAGRLADEVDRHAESVRMGVVLVTASLTLLCSYCYTYHDP